MARLSDARGDAFDRLFLELMIKHHEGALTMVKELYCHGQAPGRNQRFSRLRRTSMPISGWRSTACVE